MFKIDTEFDFLQRNIKLQRMSDIRPHSDGVLMVTYNGTIKKVVFKNWDLCSQEPLVPIVPRPPIPINYNDRNYSMGIICTKLSKNEIDQLKKNINT